MARIEDLHPDLLTRALRQLDGPALAAVNCTTSHLRLLSAHSDLWRDLCLASWPSLRLLPAFPYSHKSFFSDAHSFPSLSPTILCDYTNLPDKLVSAIDIHHRGVPILSRIVETNSSTSWFLSSPFRIDCLDPKDPLAPEPPTTSISPEDLTLSWVIIDPARQKAINVSSRWLVAMDRHWYTGETLLRFATVVGRGTEAECAVVVVVAVAACGERGHVREVYLTAEDMDGMCLNGKDSLVVIKGLMEGCRTVKNGAAETVRRYVDHVRRRRWRKERKQHWEGMLDLCCSVIGVSLFLVFLLMVVFR